MATAGNLETPQRALDAIVWRFFGSEFAGPIYIDWPLDRRVDAYLRHNGLADLANDGTLSAVLLDRIMSNMGRALRDGLLDPPNTPG